VQLMGSPLLNGICPYFTMFPLDFPLSVLRGRARNGDSVLDPFCGRGTTNFAARLLGLESLGVDSSPVAVAISAAKLVAVAPDTIVSEARRILHSRPPPHVPDGPFWKLCFHQSVLRSLCTMREVLLEDCSTPARVALRGIVLGALHGPRQKTFQSYFSNQCPRTYAPKPGYAVRYWKRHGLRPLPIDLVSVIARRADRYFSFSCTPRGSVRHGDSRFRKALKPRRGHGGFDWVVTSPPY